MKIDSEIAQLLDSEAARINNRAFIADDPVQFARRFEKKQDIEIAALLTSSIAWGNRTMICRDCERMLALMDNQPHAYVLDEGYEDLRDMNIHRTFFAENMRHYLRGLHSIYTRYESLEDYARACHVGEAELAGWALADAINEALRDANNGRDDSRCLPINTSTTALKRLNMALRWLVRDDGIVDMGIWSVIKPSQLYIPLDVHVANTSRQLGLLERKSNDKKAVIELTQTLRDLRPDDPVYYDFALFGIGITAKNKTKATN